MKYVFKYLRQFPKSVRCKTGKGGRGLFENITWVREELEAGLLALSDRWEIGREEIQEASPNFFNFCFSVRCGRF